MVLAHSVGCQLFWRDELKVRCYLQHGQLLLAGLGVGCLIHVMCTVGLLPGCTGCWCLVGARSRLQMQWSVTACAASGD
jgi:hypothetical protein